MKRLLFTALFWGMATLVFAQTINKDSVKMARDSIKQARKKARGFSFNSESSLTKLSDTANLP
jgi:hypothetical protein